MMNIDKALELFKTLGSQTNQKSETCTYNSFIQILTALQGKGLNESQRRSIGEHLTLLDLHSQPENPRKYYKKRLGEFKTFLKKEFEFTTAKHYSELFMIYGITFGGGLGISIGTAVSPTLGISLGLSIGTGLGMALGMLYGAQKDAEAKRLGKVV